MSTKATSYWTFDKYRLKIFYFASAFAVAHCETDPQLLDFSNSHTDIYLFKFVALSQSTASTTRVPCSANQFACRNGHCIPLDELCDRVDQCGDGSDETYNCTGNRVLRCQTSGPILTRDRRTLLLLVIRRLICDACQALTKGGGYVKNQQFTPNAAVGHQMSASASTPQTP